MKTKQMQINKAFVVVKLLVTPFGSKLFELYFFFSLPLQDFFFLSFKYPSHFREAMINDRTILCVK